MISSGCSFFLPCNQAASVKVALGSYVWVEDTDEAWLDGEVVEANDVEVKVKCETKMVSPLLNKKSIRLKNEICLALKLHDYDG